MHRQVERQGIATHPALAPAALGLLAAGTAFDVLSSGHAGALTCFAFWTITAGIAAGSWCATWALLDWVHVARFGEAGVCGVDGFATALAIGLYALAILFRVDSAAHAPQAAAMVLEVSGAALLAMKTWVGRELAAWLDDRR